MPAVARANGTDKVLSITGTGYKCKFPMNTSTGTSSQTRVTAQGVPIVVQGDVVAPHKMPGCVVVDTATVNTYSAKVSIGGIKIARIGDTYGQGETLNTITSGSSKVFAG